MGVGANNEKMAEQSTKGEGEGDNRVQFLEVSFKLPLDECWSEIFLILVMPKVNLAMENLHKISTGIT